MQVKYNEQVDQRLASMQSYLTQSKQVQEQLSGGREFQSRVLAPPQTHIAASGNEVLCFYCKGPHRLNDCQEVLTHLNLHWIIKVDEFVRLPDRRSIPRDGNKSMKEVVEALNKEKGDIIPVTKIQDKAALYQDSARVGTYIQTQASEDPAKLLTELVQQIGLDKIGEILGFQPQERLDETLHWDPNFDEAQ